MVKIKNHGMKITNQRARAASKSDHRKFDKETVVRAARIVINLHRDALKELERH